MRAVNLLPPERRGRKAVSLSGTLAAHRAPLAAGGVAAVVLLTLGIALHSAGSSVSSKKHELAGLQSQIAAARPSGRAGSAQLTSAEARLGAVTSVAVRRLSWDAMLGSLSRVVPEDVWLLSLSADNPSSTSTSTSTVAASGTTPPATGGNPAAPVSTPFTITGYTYSQRSVARLMNRLALVPWLGDVQLQQSQLTQLNTRTVYQFTLGATLLNPEVTS